MHKRVHKEKPGRSPQGGRLGCLLRNSIGLLLLLGGMAFPSVVHAWQADLGNGRYRNPVLFADYSDPDVIRVGPYFYLVSSSFHYMPGIPILRSRDLVNWTIIGHVYGRLDAGPAYDMADGDRYGRGCWAPAIRYHDHRYWVYFPTPDEGIFMSSARSPEGPWTPVVQVKKVHGWEDPCPFWDDDGRAYLVHSVLGAGPLILHRMSADGRTLLDDGVVIVRDTQRMPGLEGPKLYRMRGYYYIFAPAGGVNGGWQEVLRAKTISGPYEQRRVLEQGRTPINGPHQGGYVETPGGQAWFLHFQSRGAYGRILHLEPVRWVDDWPILGQSDGGNPVGHPVSTWSKPDVTGPLPIQVPQTSDEFDSPALGLQWAWNHNPDDTHWSLAERPGFLRLTATPAGTLLRARNTLTQMPADPALTATTSLDAGALADGQRAGLCVFDSAPGWIGVVQTGAQRHIAVFASGREAPGPALTQKTLQLRVHVAQEAAEFSFSLDGKTFQPLGPPVPLKFSWWKGARLGLFSFNAGPLAASSPGVADFTWFHYQPEGPLGPLPAY